MSDKHKESAEHREDKNIFAAKSVTQMAKPTCCHSTQNTLCGLNSYVDDFSLDQVCVVGEVTYTLVFELHVLGL